MKIEKFKDTKKSTITTEYRKNGVSLLFYKKKNV